ncbi:sodium-coupled monocarboxylate transporter 2-like [Dermacentor silvarum]|uniref:sodium-coupled monocarboxylate transporter 2-like n=1 Tax=Dermacentor silvarum TaxID=543639 RepID=UPI0021007883|nr:sodium-coupled monocarboxylate transporter 2-like [Dermacentor silvarum]
MQLVFMLLAPATVIAKVFLDLKSSNGTAQTVSDFDVRPYIGNFALDLTQDENVWAPLVAATTATMYRLGLDQAVVQRCMATRSLRSAQRTVIAGSLLNVAVDFINLAMTIALIFWYRGCDPELAGAIKTHDQILPFYVKNHFAQFPGFTALFLVAIVSSATSTISSIINSQAAVLYVDVLSQRFKSLDSHVHWITRGLAFLLGGFMTAYSCACFYMGSVTRRQASGADGLKNRLKPLDVLLKRGGKNNYIV